MSLGVPRAARGRWPPQVQGPQSSPALHPPNMSAVGGVKKVKKVTKTTSKKVDGGETVTETTTTMSKETSGSTGGEREVLPLR